jgi:hypothetical protein
MIQRYSKTVYLHQPISRSLVEYSFCLPETPKKESTYPLSGTSWCLRRKENERQEGIKDSGRANEVSQNNDDSGLRRFEARCEADIYRYSRYSTDFLHDPCLPYGSELGGG